MILNGRTESGAEEWICPVCSRRILLRWPPDFQKLVLEHGEDTAIHLGGKGGLQMGEVMITPTPAGDVPGGELQWLRDNGIDWDGASA